MASSTTPEEQGSTGQPPSHRAMATAAAVGAAAPSLMWLPALNPAESGWSLLTLTLIVPWMWPFAMAFLGLVWATTLPVLRWGGVPRRRAVAALAVLALVGLALQLIASMGNTGGYGPIEQGVWQNWVLRWAVMSLAGAVACALAAWWSARKPRTERRFRTAFAALALGLAVVAVLLGVLAPPLIRLVGGADSVL
ncbi:hypothetical protein [Nocardiopsis oceani]